MKIVPRLSSATKRSQFVDVKFFCTNGRTTQGPALPKNWLCQFPFVLTFLEHVCKRSQLLLLCCFYHLFVHFFHSFGLLDAVNTDSVSFQQHNFMPSGMVLSYHVKAPLSSPLHQLLFDKNDTNVSGTCGVLPFYSGLFCTLFQHEKIKVKNKTEHAWKPVSSQENILESKCRLCLVNMRKNHLRMYSFFLFGQQSGNNSLQGGILPTHIQLWAKKKESAIIWTLDGTLKEH